MSNSYEELSEKKKKVMGKGKEYSCFEKKEKYEKEENYVFIDEKYKEYFDNISDIFEEKIDYILKKHFKKNDPTNKNKLLCLNMCVLWQKKFLYLLSKSLNEYEEYKKLHDLKNDQDMKKIDDKKKEKDDEKEKHIINNNDNNSTSTTTIISTNNNNMKSNNINDNINNINVDDNNMNADDNNINIKENIHEGTNISKDDLEKDLKSYIKNVKVVDNKNIEVIYNKNYVKDDNRPSAKLSTDEIYYLLVESKKSENEYKKKIFTFLKYLPLFIQSIESKSLREKNILEQKLLLNGDDNIDDMNNVNNVNNMNHMDNMNNINNVNNMNHMDNMNNIINVNNMNNMNNMNNINNVNHFNVNNMENPCETNSFNQNISAVDIKNKLDSIVNFNCNLSENLEHVFKNKMGNLQFKNKNNFFNNFQTNSMDNEINNMNEKQNDDLTNQTYLNNINNLDDVSKLFENKKNNKSLILPLSKVNDLSLINNISRKSNNGVKEDTYENENSFYIYKNNMEKMNLYGLDLLINLNNNLIYKINHVYSLIQFYTMLAKDVFNET
ncbi:hypothetical protein PGSY75_0420600 [Plasmodium gaboni]|uniref:Uncharacterized protein n=1 Tax=Plasmodium gaboni TaxID=647221 RepID=A0A151LUQ6_9APIC|nr:hypothetical protein PGSY75_0420600 [Plasmodium gaboni]KYO02902.1 hypothetical protein PGSY75_0420600 [Plasmodium gaboni]